MNKTIGGSNNLKLSPNGVVLGLIIDHLCVKVLVFIAPMTVFMLRSGSVLLKLGNPG